MEKALIKSNKKNQFNNVQVTKKKLIDFFKSEKAKSNLVDISFYDDNQIKNEKTRILVFGENYLYLEKGFWIAFADILNLEVN